MPVAEESDLIVKLGSYVLARAVREAARWQKELPRPDSPLFVGVNVSSRQLFRPELIKDVRHILGRAVIPKGSLRLEITESLVMENPEKATAVLRQLADAGAGLALDDFGTGYSSLSYLNQFTFDTIKIDRSFLHAGGENGTGSVILRSVVALAHELGKEVVIEGVETEDDVGLLRSIGCEYGQGFYYGEPMSEREVLQLLKVARRAERRMSKKGGLLRKRPRADEGPLPAPSAAPDPDAEAPPRGAAVPQAALAANGAGLPPIPVPPKGQASASAEQAHAQLEAARQPAGPPPLPGARPANAAKADGVRLSTMPPSPLRPGASPEDAPGEPEADSTQDPALDVAADTGADSAPPRVTTGPPPLPPPGPPGPRPGQARGARPPPLPGRPNGRPQPEASTLPPAIAESLAKLAGTRGSDPDGRDRK